MVMSRLRIYHECEDRIEKSVPRIAVWHHKDPDQLTLLQTDQEHRKLQARHNKGKIICVITIWASTRQNLSLGVLTK